MRIDTRKQAGWLVCTISGRIDGTTAPELEASLSGTIDAGETRIAADLSGVQYLSSAGLRVFLATLRRLGGGEFRLLSPNEAVREVLDISGFANIMAISDSLEG
jgi:anti-anti-sigma factor